MLASAPKPTSAASTEGFQRAIRVEHLEADTGPRVDVVERLTACALFGIESHVCPPLREPARQRAQWLRSGWCWPRRAGDTARRPEGDRRRVRGALAVLYAAISEGSARARPRR